MANKIIKIYVNATKMHYFDNVYQKIQIFSGDGHCPSQTLPRVGRVTPPPRTPSPRGLRSLADISRQLISEPWQLCSHLCDHVGICAFIAF